MKKDRLVPKNVPGLEWVMQWWGGVGHAVVEWGGVIQGWVKLGWVMQCWGGVVHVWVGLGGVGVSSRGGMA